MTIMISLIIYFETSFHFQIPIGIRMSVRIR